MAASAQLLGRLERLKADFGGDVAGRKIALLRDLERGRLSSADHVGRLHEVLCFLRAYPDDADVLAVVERLLRGFAARSDLRRFRKSLADSGIAGTDIRFRFFWVMAGWLADRWPDRLSVDWSQLENRERLEKLLYLLVPYFETAALDELSLSPREWISRLKGPDESDAVFLVRRFQALRTDDFVKETLYEDVDPSCILAAGPDGPSRTLAHHDTGPVVFQRRPMRRGRPSLVAELRRPPVAVRAVSRREGRRLIDIAREAMVTRERDLDAFAYADENDVRLVDCGGGLQFACMGAIPERRLMLETVYGFITLKNGVPMGYVLSAALLRSSEVAYNVFETYRGGEAAWVFGRVLAMIRHLFGARSFSIDPYQLGYGNREGLQSGAWWFYYKLGFRPHDPDVLRVLRGELARMRKNPRHRSGVRTLERLASAHMFFSPGRDRDDVMGKFSAGNVFLKVSRHVADRFGSDREKAVRVCSSEAAELLGIRSMRSFTSAEKLAWNRWAPLVMTLPGVRRWSAADRRALVAVVRAKGGRRESEFVKRFDAHRPLTRAILKLAVD